MASSVLYHNADNSIVLIDIPASIETAQQSQLIIASTPALKTPYPSTEPQGDKRVMVLAGISARDQNYHCSVQNSIQESIAHIKTLFIDGQGGSWYRTRQYLIRSDTNTGSSWIGARALPEKSQRSESKSSLSVQANLVPVILSTTELRNNFPSLHQMQDVVVHNPRSHASRICLPDQGAFWIPPNATCIQSTLEAGLEGFMIGSKALSIPKSQAFELILMDPPWTNRSVRRSGSYQTAETQMMDPFNSAVQIARCHLVPHGIVAVWITNRSSIRNIVVETFRAMGLGLFQESIWVKITAEGHPVTQLDGVWRRPYEVCLMFRRGTNVDREPHRQILVAVPDVHSRKPNLKSLLEQHLPPRYEALELFARSMTAGWWSWGDEVLKFQHESQWTEEPDPDFSVVS
ncbi:hypothetical protein LTR84_005314 [Exophiala bonariae]|uniref:MT-A70-domain-containing protein n=1 Tax=Exophiala bonariae TaxID=1690606 RepID=A0AAV9N7K5_9EURO|nr:hypothetical protein LTR84_005314 [Exophiala bonariae]